MSPAVLIVDDSLTVRMDLHEAFEEAGFTTVLCATGADARKVFASERLDDADPSNRLRPTVRRAIRDRHHVHTVAVGVSHVGHA